MTTRLNSKKVNFIYIFSFLFFFLNCSNENIFNNAENKISKSYDIEDGVLHFKNSASVSELITKLQHSVDEKNEILLDLSQRNFRSLTLNNNIKQDFVYKTSKSDSSSSNNENLQIVEDDFFATILNEDGMLIIDNIAFKVTRDYIFSTPDSLKSLLFDEQVLNQLTTSSTSKNTKNAPSIQYINGIDVKRIERDNFEIMNDDQHYYSSNNTSNNINWTEIDLYNSSSGEQSRKTYQYTSSPDKRRAVAESWNTNWWVYASIGSETINEKQSFGIWFNAPAKVVSVQGSAKFKYKRKNPITGIETDEIAELISTVMVADDREHIKMVYDWKMPVFGNKSFLDNLKSIASNSQFDIISIQANHYVENIVGNNGWKIKIKTNLTK